MIGIAFRSLVDDSTGHALRVALLLPVRPEPVEHPVDVLDDVAAVLVEELLLREPDVDEEELSQVAEQGAVDGRGFVAQQELLRAQDVRNRHLGRVLVGLDIFR